MALVSCGVLLVDDSGRVLACHATGTSRWDLPKGIVDPGETARAAAVREAWEEAGLRVPGERLDDLGETAYLRGKRLHLFALRVADGGVELAACRCRSFFPDRRTGRPLPEADGYAWLPLDALDTWCGRNMARVIAGLDRARLAAAPRVDRVEVDTVSH
jgi:8-oxo-dGTP pyrophosphatase MutT (NUDIX family)